MQTWLASLAQQATPDLEECISQLGKLCPLLHEFKHTEQDPVWHAEGDVHIHTQMVLDALYQLLSHEAAHIQGWQRQALILGACLHDIAKPITTARQWRHERECVTARQHEDKGRSYLAPRLIELPLDYHTLHTVLALVGEHQKPKFMVMKQQGSTVYHRMARYVPLELLYWLERADIQGRISEDNAHQLDILELFKLEAIQFNCWDSAQVYQGWAQQVQQSLAAYDIRTQETVLSRGFAAFEAGQITTVEECIAQSYVYRDHYPHLTLLCGPSGSGKSRYIQQAPKDTLVIALDDLRRNITGKREDQTANAQVRHLAKEQLKQGLRDKRTIIWDATNLRYDFREQLIQLAQNYQASTELVVFSKPISQLYKDNRARPHPVPDAVLDKQLQNWQWPTPLETDRFSVVDHKGQIVWSQGALIHPW